MEKDFSEFDSSGKKPRRKRKNTPEDNGDARKHATDGEDASQPSDKEEEKPTHRRNIKQLRIDLNGRFPNEDLLKNLTPQEKEEIAEALTKEAEQEITGALRDFFDAMAKAAQNAAGVRETQKKKEEEEKKEIPPVSRKEEKEDDDDDDDFFDDDDDDDGFPNPFSQTNTKKKEKKENGKESKTPALDMFGRNLTEEAAKGKIDPVIGREREIERVAEILSRRRKNNPILIGEPGVGKSSIVEGLAMRIHEGTAPSCLLNKEIYALDMTGLVAGTKFRGQFEERIKALLDEVEESPNIILFIDEIHTLIGAGASQGGMDAANIMKPALAHGRIRCIGATTVNEYKKSIERDGALERRFQKVQVEQPTYEETLEILRQVKPIYEKFHCVSYTDDAIEACVRLSQRYISDRNFPDKALDLLDEAGSTTHLKQVDTPEYVLKERKKLEKINEKKQRAIVEQNYELASEYRDQEFDQQKMCEKIEKRWEKERKNMRTPITEEDVEKVVSRITGIPTNRLAKEEWKRLRDIKEELSNTIVAQEDAVNKVMKAIMRSKAGIKDPNRPVGTFMFLGPTGVGKTYLTKRLAELLFGSADALIRLDMGEYSHSYESSRMVGAPPGYVGYEEGGQLTDKVRRHPYSIILFDEIEKAHPDIYNTLLQLMDEGRLTDGYGTTVDCRNTIIIMTSNCGSRQLKQMGQSVGFVSPDEEAIKANSQSVIRKALDNRFTPEFLNRIDEIITFNQLGEADILKIVDLELKGLEKRMEELKHPLRLTETAKKFLAKKGYDIQFGARPLKRAIQTHVEDEICQLIMDENLIEGQAIVGDCAENDTKITFKGE
jgi:ATP-dependent Clp protease ATP-binding subunit ClpC